jgi:hypothetical protein
MADIGDHDAMDVDAANGDTRSHLAQQAHALETLAQQAVHNHIDGADTDSEELDSELGTSDEDSEDNSDLNSDSEGDKDDLDLGPEDGEDTDEDWNNGYGSP